MQATTTQSVANVYGDPGPYYGWCGANVWSSASFRLLKMVDGPEMNADKSELNAVYDQYKDLENNDYTEDSWNEFQGALENAKNVLDNETADQDAVNEAKAKLEAAVAGLTKQEEPPRSEELGRHGRRNHDSGWIPGGLERRVDQNINAF